jgi:small conductance mechanosensitive channel
MDLNEIVRTSSAILITVAWRALGAIALWIIGRWLIGFVIGLSKKALAREHVDPTVARYLQTGLSVLLNVALAIAILGFLGVETTTFAALIAAGGIAIGVAWGGLLANFAAGVFLVLFRPFKTGDVVTVAGVTGGVEAIGLFGTTLNTPDNVRTIVGNNKIFSDTIQNYSANDNRRVDITATIQQLSDLDDCVRLLKDRLRTTPNVLANPAPQVEFLQFTPEGAVLCVRPWCANSNYWQVYFDTTRHIHDVFGEALLPGRRPAYIVTDAGAQPASAMPS